MILKIKMWIGVARGLPPHRSCKNTEAGELPWRVGTSPIKDLRVSLIIMDNREERDRKLGRVWKNGRFLWYKGGKWPVTLRRLVSHTSVVHVLTSCFRQERG
jgi:hypothetical protein